MTCTHSRGIISSIVDWIHETCTGCGERQSDRKRLAQLSRHQKPLKQGAHTDGSDCQANHSEGETDNYLRGQLLHEAHDGFEKHNRETVSHWLHQDVEKPPVEPPSEAPAVARATGDLDYLISETRLLEFTDIGMGMQKDCLSTFIGNQPKAASAAGGPARSTRELMMMRDTLQDLPAMTPKTTIRLSFLPLEQPSRQIGA